MPKIAGEFTLHNNHVSNGQHAVLNCKGAISNVKKREKMFAGCAWTQIAV